MRPVDLPADIPGKLWLGSMPGRFEPWTQFENAAQRSGIGRVVCLTPRSELSELSPDYHAAVTAGRLPFRWQQVEMRNFGLPEEPASFRRDIREVADALKRGDQVYLHCAAGMGRTGSAAACVLKALGLTTEDALRRVRAAGSNPQNAEQSGLVEWF